MGRPSRMDSLSSMMPSGVAAKVGSMDGPVHYVRNSQGCWFSGLIFELDEKWGILF